MINMKHHGFTLPGNPGAKRNQYLDIFFFFKSTAGLYQ